MSVAAARTRVICVGHAALDRVFAVESWPKGSGKIPAHRFEESGGGMAANAAAAISRLGGEAVFWGPTGEDAVADAIRDMLIANGGALMAAVTRGEKGVLWLEAAAIKCSRAGGRSGAPARVEVEAFLASRR